MSDTALSRVRIVLVEPAGALNLGSIARIMKNMGLRHLVLVNPQCDRTSEEARRMAVHAADVLEGATIAASLPEALSGCHRAIATTTRTRAIATALEPPKAALPWLLNTPSTEHSALIFGSEEHGLSNEALNYAQRFVCIPSSSEYASLNLAQAVAVCCYELYQLTQAPVQSAVSSPPAEDAIAAIDTLEDYYQHLETVLLKIGYLYPHTATSRMEKFRRLFNRAALSDPEVAMLRGILRQIDWAIENKS
ncbi:RNA methyltransferase [Myxacorys almedinensis]|uniref:tRNA (cytidine/uridine-2'-O-)-methyltransferase TrmJ n=1 Tax=Myxacorys almedinensis A TaxID=2690445 RepID=A0A8J8CH08_9CYAN|nr:RNA methyltransferase [Myxacorys almedinensis]NDJ16159.1 TrmJ/YjtD family RNA methyltransferase [Myxacorys almedinensis A]